MILICTPFMQKGAALENGEDDQNEDERKEKSDTVGVDSTLVNRSEPCHAVSTQRAPSYTSC